MQIGAPIEQDECCEAVRLCEGGEIKSDGQANIRRGKLTVVFLVNLLLEDMECGARGVRKSG